ncbi:NADP-dependent 3-hydroxy acid dehydrogenase YdfG (YdfG) (PDB:3P19) [Commensalibacter communis]|uniref:SDR family oxidoreductase n=1 Tax=Commensalibacter communis TaxID=2972786 RepID=UPI0022FF98B8|nr:SDR family oxidoreductase [Commensalibacter communis]CAI3959461.1 NADP-dependent 3-hydroxy acid dehydrogenase YdfG (YdfG) (PDB:3P19) [Commensalibacter communis]
MSNSLQNKVAVVTGAASGIGLASTEILVANGATVVMVDRDVATMEKIQAKYKDKIILCVTNLIDPDSCAKMVPSIIEKTGKIDIFHANAGCYIGGDLIDSDPNDIDRLIDLNVSVVMKNIRDVLPHMIKQKSGDIIVTSSIAGHLPIHWEPVYCASKWATNSFVQTMRRQISKHGIRIGSVSPGPVISALLADWPEENLKKAKELGSLMEPIEIAEAVLFMLTRPRHVAIRDIVIQPLAQEL